ncbi:MAG: hypothetical protein RR100_06535 [Comamonas sp.]
MMLTILRRLEDVLVQVVRVVLLAFALVVLLALALWVWDSWRGNQHTSPDVAQPAALNWKDAKLDLDYVVAETGRDLGNAGNQIPLAQRLADAQLRPSFQKADQLIRAFVEQDPAARARVEQENSSRGLAPLHPLLEGTAAPDAALVQRLLKAEQENGCTAAVSAAAQATAAAAVAAASADDEETDTSWFTEPLDIPCAIHERAQMAESEHGAGSYVAYVQGLPAALQQVLGNKDLAPRLQQQAASSLVTMVLTNYTISFDQAARALRGDDTSSGDGDSLLNLYSKAAETAFWSMLMSLLVLVVMVVVFIRMERHLRVMSERATRS